MTHLARNEQMSASIISSGIGCSESSYNESIPVILEGYTIYYEIFLDVLLIDGDSSLQFCFLLAQCH
jgi:hypothetical protein